MKQKSNAPIVVIAIVLLALLALLFAIAALNLGRSGGVRVPSGPFAEALLNAPAPAFSLRDQRGRLVSSAELKGKKVVLFFNEGLRCYPACWNAMIALAQDPRFNGNDVQVYSIVVDDADEWRRASEKVPELREVNVLFDADRTVSAAFGMLTLPSSMHRGSLPGHTYVLLDSEGAIRWIEDDPRMGIGNDALASRLSALGRGDERSP